MRSLSNYKNSTVHTHFKSDEHKPHYISHRKCHPVFQLTHQSHEPNQKSLTHWRIPNLAIRIWNQQLASLLPWKWRYSCYQRGRKRKKQKWGSSGWWCQPIFQKWKWCRITIIIVSARWIWIQAVEERQKKAVLQEGTIQEVHLWRKEESSRVFQKKHSSLSNQQGVRHPNEKHQALVRNWTWQKGLKEKNSFSWRNFFEENWKPFHTRLWNLNRRTEKNGIGIWGGGWTKSERRLGLEIHWQLWTAQKLYNCDVSDG